MWQARCNCLKKDMLHVATVVVTLMQAYIVGMEYDRMLKA
jgi:hypothetical protein